MTKPWPGKFPDENLDYQYDWTDLVGDDTIVGTPVAEALGSVGLTIESNEIDGFIQTIWVSGGAPNPLARIALLAVTTAGRTIEDVVGLPVKRP